MSRNPPLRSVHCWFLIEESHETVLVAEVHQVIFKRNKSTLADHSSLYSNHFFCKLLFTIAFFTFVFHCLFYLLCMHQEMQAVEKQSTDLRRSDDCLQRIGAGQLFGRMPKQISRVFI